MNKTRHWRGRLTAQGEALVGLIDSDFLSTIVIAQDVGPLGFGAGGGELLVRRVRGMSKTD